MTDNPGWARLGGHPKVRPQRTENGEWEPYSDYLRRVAIHLGLMSEDGRPPAKEFPGRTPQGTLPYDDPDAPNAEKE